LILRSAFTAYSETYKQQESPFGQDIFHISIIQVSGANKLSLPDFTGHL